MQVIVFENGKAKQIQNATERLYRRNKNAIINPDISKVKGKPLEHWKRKGRKVEYMTKSERDQVDAKKAKK